MKKLLYLTMTLYLCVILTGCTIKHHTKTIIKFSTWGSESEIKILKPLLKDFEKENPDITVELIHIPKNYFQKLHLLVASNLTPDVIFINNTSAPIYYQNGILQDLTPYFNNKKDFFTQSLDGFKYQNRLYAIPRDISNLVIYYNKDLFEKYHVNYPNKNWTLEDFLETAKKLTHKNLFGVGFEDSPLYWTPFLWSNGGDLIDMKNPKSLEGLQFYANLRNKYKVAPPKSFYGNTTMSELFMESKIAMQINGRWCVPRYREDLRFDWDIAPFPKGKNGSIVDGDSSGWAMSANSKHKKEAWKLIYFLSSEKSSKKFTSSGLIIPAQVNVANSEIFLNKTQKPKNSQIFIDIIKTSKPTFANKNFSEMQDLVQEIIEPVFNGQKTSKQAFNDKNIKKIDELLEF
jgi:multiple sugar transport system substrate-binding protein